MQKLQKYNTLCTNVFFNIGKIFRQPFRIDKNPSALLKKLKGEPVITLNHNKPSAYLVPAKIYEATMDILEDHELGEIIRKRQYEKDLAVEGDDITGISSIL